MLLSAVKVSLLLSGGQFAVSDSLEWKKLRSSIAYLSNRGTSVGAGAFISPEGYLVTHTLTMAKGPDRLITATGQTLTFKVVHKDTPSQLVLLKTDEAPKTVGIVDVLSASDKVGTNMLAVLATGPVRAELGTTGVVGVDDASKRSVPMNMIKIEDNGTAVGGGLVFSGAGKFVGAFAATLPVTQNSNMNAFNLDLNQRSGAPKSTLQSPNSIGNSQSQQRQNLGPQSVIVGYSPTWEVMNKAVTGFLSPDHKAEYGLLGIYVKENAFHEMEIVDVFANSPAVLAGVHKGDQLVSVDGTRIRTQLDFARALYRLTPDASIQLIVRRGTVLMPLTIKVGRQLSARSGNLVPSIEGSSLHETRSNLVRREDQRLHRL